MRTHFYMLYCADKHKMAYCVFIAVVCVLCFCFLRLFAASLIQLTWDKKKQTTITKIHRIQDMHVHHAATLWAWYGRPYHHAAVASELRLHPFSVNWLRFSVLLLWRQQHEALHANTHKLSTGQRTCRSNRQHLTSHGLCRALRSQPSTCI